MKYDILLFDLDGTLLDFDRSETEAFKRLMSEKGVTYTDGLFKLYKEVNGGLWREYEKGEIDMAFLLKTRFKRTMERIGLDIDGLQWENQYRGYLGEYGYIIDGADEVVKNLSEGRRIFAVTNGVGDTQINRLKIAGMLGYFEEVFISQVIGHQKPSLEFFDFVMSKIKGFDRRRALIIGDSPLPDILGGKNAGIDTCLVSLNGKKNETDIKSDYTVGALRELYEICG